MLADVNHPAASPPKGIELDETSFRFKTEITLLKFVFKPLIRRSARQNLQGRLLDPDLAERGRWLRGDVNRMLGATWNRVDELLPKASLGSLPSTGNRGLVFLAIVTTAAFQVLVQTGHSKQRAADLVADIGWKIYELGIRWVSLPFRATTRDPGKRIERTIAAMLVFPFGATGRPGYEVRVERHSGQLSTDWTWCPPQAFVRNLVEKQGDGGELEAFYRSWCLYDWPGADIMAGDGKHGHYQRSQTLSRGDAVCDMCWKHKAP